MTRDDRLTCEVLGEFVESGHRDDAVSLIEGGDNDGTPGRRGTYRQRREQWSQYASNALYMPPWWDACGEYGPRSEAVLSQELTHYGEGRASGGLWDHETEADHHPETAVRAVAQAADRFDAEPMRRFVERYSARISERLLEVYQAFYVDRQSRGNGARRMGVSKNTFCNQLTTLRRLATGKARFR